MTLDPSHPCSNPVLVLYPNLPIRKLGLERLRISQVCSSHLQNQRIRTASALMVLMMILPCFHPYAPPTTTFAFLLFPYSFLLLFYNLITDILIWWLEISINSSVGTTSIHLCYNHTPVWVMLKWWWCLKLQKNLLPCPNLETPCSNTTLRCSLY